MVSTDDELSVAGTAARPPDPDIASAAARLGAYSWISAQMFEVVGSWVASTQEPEVKVLFGEMTAEWAWHAELWRERLPELREVNRHDLVVPPAQVAIDAVSAMSNLTDTGQRLHALDGLCARLDAVYAVHEQAADSVRDAPTFRTLRLVRSDLASGRSRMALLEEFDVTPATQGASAAPSGDRLGSQLDQTFEVICARSTTLRAEIAS